MARRPRPPRYWTAAVTHRGEEQRAAYHIERLGFEYLLPRTLEYSDKTDEYSMRRLLMPGYIFVRMNWDWERVHYSRGVARMLLTDEKPIRIPDREISYLQAQLDEDGYVRMRRPARAGDRVTVASAGGAYAGQSGVVCNMLAAGRCVVLLHMLGRDVRTVFHGRMLETS